MVHVLQNVKVVIGLLKANNTTFQVTRIYFIFQENWHDWSTLSDRRKESRLNMFGKAVAGRISISVDKFTKPIKCKVFVLHRCKVFSSVLCDGNQVCGFG